MGRTNYRFFLSVVLSFSIVFSSFPFQQLAQAQSSGDVSGTVESENESANREKSLEQLKASFLTESTTKAHLDTFLLTRQVVVDPRPENLAAVVKEEQVQDYADRLDYLRDQSKQLAEIATQVAEKIKLEKSGEANLDRLTELDMLTADINSRSAILEIELKDLLEHGPDSDKPIEIDSFVDTDLRVRHYFGKNLQVILENADGRVQVREQKDFTQSLSPRFSIENPLADVPHLGWYTDETKMMIANDRGEVMHRFLDSIEAVFFFGEYLVYIEKNTSVSDSGVLPIRFIDLRYFRTNIGNGPLPVFTLPLNVNQRPESFSIENGYLKIDNQRLSYQQLNVLAKVQQVMFNVNVALVDPDAYENVKPLISEITEFFAKSMNGQSSQFQAQLKEVFGAEAMIGQAVSSLEAREQMISGEAKKLATESLADGKITDAEYEKLVTALDSSDRLTTANSSLAAGRGLMTRIRLFGHFLVQPRPEGAPKLFNALVLLASGSSSERNQVLTLAKGSPLNKFVKYGAGISGLLLAGTQLPEPYQVNLHNAFDLISAVSQHFQGYLINIDFGRAYVELSKDAFVTSTTGWTYFLQSYITDGKWPKFLFGLSQVLLVPMKMFAMIHITVNSVKMLGATFNTRRAIQESGLGSNIGFFKAFKRAAQIDQAQYWKRLSDAEEALLEENSKDVEIDEESKKIESERKSQLVGELIERLKQKRESMQALQRDVNRGGIHPRSSIGQYLKTMIGFVKLNRFGKSVNADYEEKAKMANVSTQISFIKALRNVFVSYSSLHTTYKMSATVWGYFFMSRSFFFSPAKWMMALVYPNYFGRTVSVREGEQHFPSKYNGGLTVLPALLHKGLSVAISHTPVSKFPGFNKLFISKEGLANLRSFEEQIIPIEAVAIEVAKKRAQKALIQSIDNPDRLAAIFNSSDNTMGVSTGIRKLSDPKIRRLQRRDKLFYRAYFTRTYDLFMQHAMSEIVELENGKTMDPRDFARRFKTQIRLNNVSAEALTQINVEDVELRLESSSKFVEVKDWALKVASDGVEFFTRLNIQFRHKLLESIHPKNYQIERFLLAKKKKDEPRAMERAMRMEVSNMVSSIPIGILSTLALYAGVQTGMMVPFDPTALNTDEHYAYMSRYLFYAGFVPGIIMGMLGNTWVKLQEDSRIDALGGFDKAIKQSDGRKSFVRMYFKNTFKHPKNKWKQNQLFILKLVAANIPAAGISFAIASAYGLGRLDVGSFIGLYIVYFTTMLPGFGLKMDQGFELTSKWVFNKIPRQLRADPQAQKYMGAQLQKRKIIYSYFESLFGIIVVENIAGDMITLKDNAVYGTRAFLRSVFGGETPATIIASFADKMIEAFGKIPGVESTFNGIKYVFTNGYEAFERFPEDLVQANPGVEQVQLPNDLPKSVVGEVVGKGIGLVTTLGGLTAAPYAIDAALQLRREKKIQKKGAAILCKQVFKK